MFIKQSICCSLVIGIILLFLFAAPFYGAVYGQSPGNLTSQSTPTEWVKIANPVTGQKVVAGQELEVAGESSDSTSKDCQVSVIVNNVKPYQKAFAIDPSGDSDFSKWGYAIRENYTNLNEGENKITAKLSCLTPLVTRWYSVLVTGASTTETVNTTEPTTATPHSDFNSTGSIEALRTLRSEEPPSSIPLPTPSAGITSVPADNNQSLRVSINSQKNPVSRGDNQSITITVTDSNSKKIPRAQIDGVLKYPGANYEKDFGGITDLDGNFLYLWTIGENGDLGELVIEIEVTSPGYNPRSVTSSIELVGPSDSSVIVNSAANSQNQSISTEKDGFHLVAAGDYGCNAVTKEVVNKMKEKNPDLVLAIGDLSEDKDPDCFFDLFSGYEDNVKVAFGEHDTDSNDKDDSTSRFSQYESHFDLDEPFYSFDYHNVHFLAMSTGKDEVIPFGIGSPQYNFVVNDLTRASSNQDIDWIIVYGYRPFYSSPTVHPAPKLTRDVYHPLFEKYGVDLVITAHNHNYQRTYPLGYNIADSHSPIILDKKTSIYNNELNGPIFVTVGTAGEILHNFINQQPFVKTQFLRHGFLNLEVTNNGSNMTGTFYENNGLINEDQFTILKKLKIP